MTTTTLGIAVQSNAGTAAVDLDKLTAAAAKAEQGATRVGRASRDMSSALQPMTAILANIERNTATMAAGLTRLSTATTQVRAAATSATTAIGQEATAIRSATDALRMNTQAANENRTALAARSQTGGANFNTANVAAQFQDIAVTSAMGMSPLQIALQQGTQLSAVLGGQGLTGVVRTLGAAFASIVSPVSLLTLGVVAFASYGIQALMSMANSTDTAVKSLDDYRSELEGLLDGWDAAGEAATRALDLAAKMPQGVVLSDLQASLADQAKAAQELQDRLTGVNSGLASTTEMLRQFQDIGRSGGEADGLGPVIEQIEALQNLGISATSTSAELDVAATAARNLFNTTDDPAIKQLADDVYQLVNQLRLVAGAADAASGAIRAMSLDAVIAGSFSQLTGATDAIQQLKSLTPDLRSAAERAQAIYDANSGSDVTGDMKLQLDYTLAQIKAQEDQRASLKASRSASKDFDQWGGAMGNFQQRIDAMRLEMQTLGQSTYEIERQKAAFDLLNQAKQAGVAITSGVTDEINRMSAEYASATVELERAAEAQRAQEEMLNFYRGTFNGFFSDLSQGLKEGQGVWQSFGNAVGNVLDNIANRLMNMASNSLFDMLLGGIMGGISGNSLGGGWGVAGGFGRPGIFGIPGMATGGTVSRSGLSWVGERGPELLSLPRGAQVIPHAQSMAMTANGNGMNDNRRGDLHLHIQSGLSEEQLGRAIANGIRDYDQSLAPKVEAKFRTMQSDPRAADGSW
jgi:hypothetical protein